MSASELRQVKLAGEILPIRVSNVSEFDEIENYAKSTLDRYLKMESNPTDIKKQIIMALLVTSAEVIKLQKQIQSETEFLEKSTSQLNELISLVEDTLETQTK